MRKIRSYLWLKHTSSSFPSYSRREEFFIKRNQLSVDEIKQIYNKLFPVILNEKSNESVQFASELFEAKNNYFTKISNILQDPDFSINTTNDDISEKEEPQHGSSFEIASNANSHQNDPIPVETEI